MVREKLRKASLFHGVCRPDFAKTAIGTAHEQYTVRKGGRISIGAYVMNAGGKQITYKSKDRSVARVSKRGALRGVRAGKTSVTIRCGQAKKIVAVRVV